MKPLLLLLSLLLPALAPAQTWLFTQKIDGEKCENVSQSVLSPQGDLILSGIYEDEGGAHFESTAGNAKDFKPNADTFPHSHSTLYIAKYTKGGQFLWSVNAYAAFGITPWDLHCDHSGNILVCGNFRGVAVFNSSNGKSQVLQGVKAGEEVYHNPLNYYVAKYSPDGNLLWVTVGHSQENSCAFKVLSDAQDNVYVKGYCGDNRMAFNQFVLLPDISKPLQVNNLQFMLMKYSPEGVEQWLTYAGDFNPVSMEVSPSGRVKFLCYTSEKLKIYHTDGKLFHFDAPVKKGPAFLELDEQGYVASLTPIKNEFKDANIQKMVKDSSGNMYAIVLPYANESQGRKFAFFWNDKRYLTQWYDLFLAKMDSTGNVKWLVQIGGKEEDRPLDLKLDRNNNVIVSGWYRASTLLRDVNGDSLELRSQFRGLFLGSYSEHGTLNWATNCGQLFYNGFQEYLHLLIDKDNRLFVGGQVNMDCTIGNRKMTLKGPLGDQKAANSGNPYGWRRYSDGFWSCMDLRQFTPDTNLLVLEAQEPPSLPETPTPAIASAEPPTQPQTVTVFPEPEENEVEANTVVLTNADVLLYPNPVGYNTSIVNVQLTLPSKTLIKWTVYDYLGQLLSQKSASYGPGVVVEQFEFNGYAAGAYLILIEMGRQRLVKKVVVL